MDRETITRKREYNIYNKVKKIKLKTRKYNNNDYATWSDVWNEVLKVDDKATFHVHETEKGFPAFINSTGGLVKVSVTIKGVTRTQWLGLMVGYSFRPITKEMITTNDIQNTIQRCLVKCIALFGLGLSIYQGEEHKEEIQKND